MQTKTDKNREQENTTLPNATHEPTQGGTAQHTDNRPSTIYQRKLRETMNTSAASESLSIQRKVPKGSYRFQQIATDMGAKYGVDTSGLEATHNSPFPEKLNAEATIQGNKIDFGPKMDTVDNMKHEVAHFIDNTVNGAPKGDTVVNGQKVDTTREKVVDRMANESAMQLKGKDRHIDMETSMVGVKQSDSIVQRKQADEQEERLIAGLQEFGILDFIGLDEHSVYGLEGEVSHNWHGIQPGNEVKLGFLSSGAQKRAYHIEGDWILLLSPQRQAPLDELDLLLEIQEAGARIPDLLEINPVGPYGSPGEKYLIETKLEISDYKDQAVGEDVDRLFAARRAFIEYVVGHQLSPQEIGQFKTRIRRRILNNDTPHTSEAYAGERMNRASDQAAFRSQKVTPYNWGPNADRWGFIQQRIRGTELGKDAQQNANFR